MQKYFLVTIHGSNYIITEEQKKKVEILIELQSFEKEKKLFRIKGSVTIPVNQVAEIVEYECFFRQQKMKLAEKRLRMCRRCGMVCAISERCPCQDRPDKYPELLEEARKDNPELAKLLDQIAQEKALPPPTIPLAERSISDSSILQEKESVI